MTTTEQARELATIFDLLPAITWTAHRGDDYACILAPGQTTEDATIHLYDTSNERVVAIADVLSHSRAAAIALRALADQVDGRNDGERRFKEWLETNPEAKPEGTVEALAQSATMLETWGPECFPVDEHGKVHFARAMMEGVAVEIRAFLAALNAGGERG